LPEQSFSIADVGMILHLHLGRPSSGDGGIVSTSDRRAQ
jgi:hypothetical protein